LRTRWMMLGLGVLLMGALGGAMLAPPPAGAISKEMIELQQQVQQLAQAQRDMRSAMDTQNATLKTLVQQSLDSVNQLNNKLGVVEKTVQEMQANTGSRIDTMTTQTQGLSDNMQDMQARVAKLSQQVTDMQSLLQTIDAKLAGTGSAAANSGGAGGGSAPLAMPPISADTLYQNGLRDYNGGNYDLARQEFSDYLKNFPTNPLAGNAQFYLGEVSFAQGNYADAVTQYDIVLYSYPKSFKLADALLKKGQAEIKLGQKASGTRDLREVVRRFPGTDEAKQAQAKLKEMGASAGSAPPTRR
jgi:tol-pal system protein YbgF